VKRIGLSLVGTLALFSAGCGGLGSSQNQPPPPPQTQLTMSPQSATVAGDDTQQFAAQASDGSSPLLAWTVNGVVGGSATTGTISRAGLYTAPEFPPTPNTITIGVSETATPSIKTSGAVTLDNPVPQISSLSPTQFPVGAFTLTVSGAHFATNAVVLFGTTALTTTRTSSTQLSATGTATSAQEGNVSVTVKNPDPGSSTSGSLTAFVVGGNPIVSQSAAVRFLEQSTFGPTPELVTQVQQTGFDPFLQAQFAAPVSVYPAPLSTDMGLAKVQNQFFLNGVNDADQLRQRIAFALNEIWVVGENKVNDPTGYTNYIQALTNDALGNYYDVMTDVTLTPAMGHWLDMVNNDKPATGQHANENYARESMQLFTIGLSQLNTDGTQVLDGSGNPIPTYTQNDVMALGRSFTGWTYPTVPGATLLKHNPSYYGGPMVPFESNHDSGAKTFLGQSVAAGQSAEQELANVLTIIFNNSNLPPFVCQQLIAKLVTSNPSPAYVARVTAAFTSGKFQSYGSGKRGDMQAVAAAILLDAEARRGDLQTTAVATDGKLREPVVMMVGLARAFHANTDGTGFTVQSGNMSQSLFNSGSVFNFFPPQSLIPGTTLNGPEFAIFNTATSLNRVNFINTLVYGKLSGTTTVDFTPVINAGTPDQMVSWLNNLFLHGTMSSQMQSSIMTALGAVGSTDTTNQAKTAIYLVTSSSQYQVQR
jgi:uncharacterized protein (DUF1800 family)